MVLKNKFSAPYDLADTDDDLHITVEPEPHQKDQEYWVTLPKTANLTIIPKDGALETEIIGSKYLIIKKQQNHSWELKITRYSTAQEHKRGTAAMPPDPIPIPEPPPENITIGDNDPQG